MVLFGPGQSVADDRTGGPFLSAGSGKASFPEDEQDSVARAGLYKKHVEELKW